MMPKAKNTVFMVSSETRPKLVDSLGFPRLFPFAGEAIFLISFFFRFSLLLPIEHNESSRLAVSACACVRAFARCGASKFGESLKVPFSECLHPSL